MKQNTPRHYYCYHDQATEQLNILYYILLIYIVVRISQTLPKNFSFLSFQRFYLYMAQNQKRQILVM
jgi:hypothetical protein